MENKEKKEMGKYDKLFFDILPKFLYKENDKNDPKLLVCISANSGEAIFGFKGVLTEIKPYDYIIINNEPIHFIDNNNVILYLGFFNESLNTSTKVQTLYKPDLYRRLAYKFNNKIFKGYRNQTDDTEIVQDQQKILGYSVKLDQMIEGFNNIGKPTNFPTQYRKK